MLGESTMMIGDCKTRMENAFNDLLAAVVRSAPSCLQKTPHAKKKKKKKKNQQQHHKFFFPSFILPLFFNEG